MLAAPQRCKKRGCGHFIRKDEHGGWVHHVNCRTPDVDLAKVGKQSASKKLYDGKRGSSAKRGYSYAWQKARKGYLASVDEHGVAKHATCDFCTLVGIVTASTVVDHIKPYSSIDVTTGKKIYDKVLQWDSKGNWQPLCKHHHDKDKQRIEAAWRQGKLPDEALRGIGVSISMPT